MQKQIAVLFLCTIILAITLETIPLASAKQNVTFSLNYGWLSGTMDSSIEVPSGTVSSGDQKALTWSLNTNKMNITLDIPNVGSTSMQVDALGNNSYSIPGLQYDYLLVKLGLYLTIESSILGELSVDNNATVSDSTISWLNSGSQNVILNVPRNATQGETFTLTLNNLVYRITAGVKAQGQVLGQPTEIQIINNQPIGEALGSPSSVSGTFTINPSTPILAIALWVVAGAMIGLCVFFGFIFYKTKRTTLKISKPPASITTAPPTMQTLQNRFCGVCGTNNSLTAKFCKKCGKRLPGA